MTLSTTTVIQTEINNLIQFPNNLIYKSEEISLRKPAEVSDWTTLSKNAEDAVRATGVRLFALLLLLKNDSSEEGITASQHAEQLLPPEHRSIWRAYTESIPVNEKIEQDFIFIFKNLLHLIRPKDYAPLLPFIRSFSASGKQTAAHLLMDTEDWNSVLFLLDETNGNYNEEQLLMKGICLFRTGSFEKARTVLLQTNEISSSPEITSYLEWIQEAGKNA